MMPPQLMKAVSRTDRSKLHASGQVFRRMLYVSCRYQNEDMNTGASAFRHWGNKEGASPSFFMRSAVVQLAQQACGQSSRNPALHQEVADPIKQWDRIRGGETLFDGLQLLQGSATPQGIDQGVFLGALSQQLGGLQVEKQTDPFVMAPLRPLCHALCRCIAELGQT